MLIVGAGGGFKQMVIGAGVGDLSRGSITRPGSEWGANMCAERLRTAFNDSERNRADPRKLHFRRSAQ
jgi:hypothetical protein